MSGNWKARLLSMLLCLLSAALVLQGLVRDHRVGEPVLDLEAASRGEWTTRFPVWGEGSYTLLLRAVSHDPQSAGTPLGARPQELRQHPQDAGFELPGWRDYPDAGLAWFTAAAARIGQGPLPALGIPLFLGSEYPAMARNQLRNLREGRILVAQVTAKKQS